MLTQFHIQNVPQVSKVISLNSINLKITFKNETGYNLVYPSNLVSVSLKLGSNSTSETLITVPSLLDSRILIPNVGSYSETDWELNLDKTKFNVSDNLKDFLESYLDFVDIDLGWDTTQGSNSPNYIATGMATFIDNTAYYNEYPSSGLSVNRNSYGYESIYPDRGTPTIESLLWEIPEGFTMRIEYILRFTNFY